MVNLAPYLQNHGYQSIHLKSENGAVILLPPESWRRHPSLCPWPWCAGTCTGFLCLPVWTTRSWSSRTRPCMAWLHSISAVCCSGTSRAVLSAPCTVVSSACPEQSSARMVIGPSSMRRPFCGTRFPQELVGQNPWLCSRKNSRLFYSVNHFKETAFYRYFSGLNFYVCSAFECFSQIHGAI